MIKTILCCDGCGVELKPSYELMMESQTKEWDMRSFVFCDRCAKTIDNTVLKFKLSILEGRQV